MEKSKSLKKTVVALLIFGVIAFVCWALFFVIFTVGSLFGVHLANLIRMFNPTGLSTDMYLPNSIGVLVIAVLLFAALILMLIFSLKKRRAIIVLPYLLLLASGFAVLELVANYPKYTIDNTSGTGYLYFIASGSVSQKMMAIVIMVCAIIAVVLALLAYIFATIEAFKNPKSAKAVVEQPEEEPEVNLEAEPVPEFEEEPEVEKEKTHIDDELVLMDKIRMMIREEIKAAQPAVSFAAPLIVQYFNGIGPTAAPQEKQPEPEPVVKPEPEPAPVVEEPAPEPAPVAEEPAPEPEPVVEVPAPVVEPEPEKAKIIRIPFQERMVDAEDDMKANYNELKNEILSYGVKSRVSNSGDTFRLHRKTYVKLTIAGKSLKLYFALNPDDYKDSTIPVQDASDKNIYADIPLIFKVKSNLSLKRAKQLIADVMSPDGLVQGEVDKVNWVKEIAAELKEGKKAEKDDDED